MGLAKRFLELYGKPRSEPPVANPVPPSASNNQPSTSNSQGSTLLDRNQNVDMDMDMHEPMPQAEPLNLAPPFRLGSSPIASTSSSSSSIQGLENTIPLHLSGSISSPVVLKLESKKIFPAPVAAPTKAPPKVSSKPAQKPASGGGRPGFSGGLLRRIAPKSSENTNIAAAGSSGLFSFLGLTSQASTTTTVLIVPVPGITGSGITASSSTPAPIVVQAGGTGQMMPWLNVIVPAPAPNLQNAPAPDSELEGIFCTVQYYELATKVGEEFVVPLVPGNLQKFIVDGYAEPKKSGHRFSIGACTSIYRDESIQQTRASVRKGAEIFWANNKLYVTCLSESPVFFHSWQANVRNRVPDTTVVRVTHKDTEEMFDFNEFKAIVNRCVNTDGTTFADRHGLHKMCKIEMSFVKGWGGQYNRLEPKDTPCWIEIRLFHPMAWLDGILLQYPGPLSNDISSNS